MTIVSGTRILELKKLIKEQREVEKRKRIQEKIERARLRYKGFTGRLKDERDGKEKELFKAKKEKEREERLRDKREKELFKAKKGKEREEYEEFRKYMGIPTRKEIIQKVLNDSREYRKRMKEKKRD